MLIHPRITAVTVETRFLVALTFADGSTGSVDLGPWIEGRRGVFVPLHDPAFFRQVSVDHDAGTIVWPNGVDLDPDMLYEAVHDTSAGMPGA
jgi:hypothetical protein